MSKHHDSQNHHRERDKDRHQHRDHTKSSKHHPPTSVQVATAAASSKVGEKLNAMTAAAGDTPVYNQLQSPVAHSKYIREQKEQMTKEKKDKKKK